MKSLALSDMSPLCPLCPLCLLCPLCPLCPLSPPCRFCLPCDPCAQSVSPVCTVPPVSPVSHVSLTATPSLWSLFGHVLNRNSFATFHAPETSCPFPLKEIIRTHRLQSRSSVCIPSQCSKSHFAVQSRSFPRKVCWKSCWGARYSKI